MSKSSSKGKYATEEAKILDTDSSVSSEDDEETEDVAREETPDLYRNSALGMYGGVSGHHSKNCYCFYLV